MARPDAARAQDDRVIIVDALNINAPKTKDIVSLLETTGAEGNTLILTHASRTQPKVADVPLEDDRLEAAGVAGSSEATSSCIWPARSWSKPGTLPDSAARVGMTRSARVFVSERAGAGTGGRTSTSRAGSPSRASTPSKANASA